MLNQHKVLERCLNDLENANNTYESLLANNTEIRNARDAVITRKLTYKKALSVMYKDFSWALNVVDGSPVTSDLGYVVTKGDGKAWIEYSESTNEWFVADAEGSWETLSVGDLASGADNILMMQINFCEGVLDFERRA